MGHWDKLNKALKSQVKEKFQEQFHFRRSSQGFKILLPQLNFTISGMTIILTFMLAWNDECFIALQNSKTFISITKCYLESCKNYHHKETDLLPM